MELTRSSTSWPQLSVLAHEDHMAANTHASKFIPDNVQPYLDYGLFLVLAGGLSFLGIAANMINVRVFSKQGLQDSASVSLLCLSITDLGVCVFTMLGAIFSALNKLVARSAVDFDSLLYILASFPRVYFAEMSMCTSVVLSLERCLCVIRPLTFKRIINKWTTVTALIILYAEVWAIACPLFAMHGLAWQYDQVTNSTRLKLNLKEGPVPRQIIMHHTVNNFVLTSLSMAVIIVCTVVMATRLLSSKKFRQKTRSASHDQTISHKDIRLVKLVTLISVIFLACYIPLMIVTVVVTENPEIDAFGQYVNLNDTLWGCVWVLAAFNSTVNILVYYKVSSKFKLTFLQIFSNPKIDIVVQHNVQKKKMVSDKEISGTTVMTSE